MNDAEQACCALPCLSTALHTSGKPDQARRLEVHPCIGGPAGLTTPLAQVRIAVVGEGTGDVLRGAPEASQLDIAFTPTKARRRRMHHLGLAVDEFLHAEAVSTPCSASSFVVMRLCSMYAAGVAPQGRTLVQEHCSARVCGLQRPAMP